MENITTSQIINSLNECFALIDFDGKIIDANDLLAKLLGVKRMKLIGEHAASFWAPAHRAQIREGIDQTKLKGRLENRIGALFSKTRKEIPVAFNTILMSNDNGKPYAILVIVKDLRKIKKHITGLKASRNTLKDKIRKKNQDILETNHRLSALHKQLVAQEAALKSVFKEIKETQRLKSIYLSGLSEEFYGPLSSIGGFTEILKEGACKDPENEKEFIKDIKNQAEYLQEVLESLDDLLRIEKDDIKVKYRKTDLFVVYSNLKNIYQNILEFNKNIELDFIFPYEPLPDVDVDRAKLKLVMINLINTAIAHINGSGKIIVRVVPQVKEGVVRTMVETVYTTSDKDDSLEERYSELFKVKKEISGIGLERTKKIIECMDGSFSFETKDEGSIVIASFTVPMYNPRKKETQKIEI